jgi:hypothetical protein
LQILLRRQRGAHVPLHRIHDRPRLVGRDADADEGILQRAQVVHDRHRKLATKDYSRGRKPLIR